MIENAATCRVCTKPLKPVNPERLCSVCRHILEVADGEGKHLNRLEKFEPSPQLKDFLEGRVASYKLPCGCTMPPGCACQKSQDEANRVARVLVEATGLSHRELEALRKRYLANNDIVGLTQKLDELARLRGNTLLISRK